MILNYTPPFYILPQDFFNFIIDEKQNNSNNISVLYGDFLLNILKHRNMVMNMMIDAGEMDDMNNISYNYQVKKDIMMIHFDEKYYNSNHTLIKFYLLIHHETRFNQRNEIVDNLEKLMLMEK
jgi:hypothetical protein